MPFIPYDRFGKMQIEARVKAQMDGSKYYTLYGYIDIWGDTGVVYDYKISKDKKWFDMEQVLFYLFLASVYTNKPHFTGGILAPLLKDPFISIEFTADDFKRMHRELKSEFNDIFQWLKTRKAGGTFPIKKSDENCRDCPFKNAGCHAWSWRATHRANWIGPKVTN